MHLTEQQFLKLVHPTHTKLYNSIDKTNWPEAWQTYFQEAKRFNQDTLISIFGDIEPIPSLPSSVIDFTDRQRLLIGEFLRRNHPRLAHDVALGLGGHLSLPEMLPGFDNRIRDLIGYIARSHGMDLRATFPYINSEFDIRDFNRIHIVYLMGLIRLADYAQIQATRAPTLRARIHPIKSPISQREWRVHQSVVNITRTHDDPEAILIDSRPTNVSDFLRVKGWLTDLQSEMDKTWAVLGEIYGRQGASRLDQLHLSVRRIRSNVLDNFVSPDFIPESISFKVAETEMLSLLLSPLYGDHPGYGVRELIQNARDAVIEAKVLDAPHLKKDAGQVDVYLNISDSGALFRIVDNGVGMDVDILKNYFLNAGASYRASKSWQADYVDDEGHSSIARSGRFGVGALAAFLIGPKISIKTRRWNSNDSVGFTFTAGLHDREIEIRPTKCSVGCEISIELDLGKAKRLIEYFTNHKKYYSFDQNSAKVTIHLLNGNSIEEIPILNDLHDNPVNSFYTSKFRNVSWGLTNDRAHRSNFVNGIAIKQIEEASSYRKIDSLYSFGELFNSISFDRDILYYENSNSMRRRADFWISLEDYDAFAPLNLPRTQFNSHDQEITDRIDDVLFSSFKNLILKDTKEISAMRNFVCSTDNSPYIHVERGAFLYRNGDFVPYDFDIAQGAGIDSIINLGRGYDGSEEITRNFEDTWFSCRGTPSESPSTLARELRNMRQFVDFGEYDYIVSVISEEAADSLTTLVKPVRWMVDLVTQSPRIKRFGHQFVVVEFGEKDAAFYEKVLAIAKTTKSRLIDAYQSKTSDFFYSGYSRGRPPKGCFFQRWIDSFPLPSHA